MNKMFCDNLFAVQAFINELKNNPYWDDSQEPTVHCYVQNANNGKSYTKYYVMYKLK